MNADHKVLFETEFGAKKIHRASAKVGTKPDQTHLVAGNVGDVIIRRGFDFDDVMQVEEKIHHAKGVVTVFAKTGDLEGQVDFGGRLDDHKAIRIVLVCYVSTTSS